MCWQEKPRWQQQSFAGARLRRVATANAHSKYRKPFDLDEALWTGKYGTAPACGGAAVYSSEQAIREL